VSPHFKKEEFTHFTTDNLGRKVPNFYSIPWDSWRE